MPARAAAKHGCGHLEMRTERSVSVAIADGYVLPIIDCLTARAMNHRLVAPLSGWRNDMASLPHWYREA